MQRLPVSYTHLYNDVFDFPYEFAMWQYTNKGTVDGIEGEVDLNLCFKKYGK